MEFILKNKKLFAVAFWIWVVAITYFTLTPKSPEMKMELHGQNYRLDYILHFLVYFGLSILYLLWKADNFFILKPKLLIYFILAGLFFSGLGEYMQTFIPNRSFNLFDFYSNAAGIIFGVIAPKLLWNLLYNKNTKVKTS